MAEPSQKAGCVGCQKLLMTRWARRHIKNPAGLGTHHIIKRCISVPHIEQAVKHTEGERKSPSLAQSWTILSMPLSTFSCAAFQSIPVWTIPSKLPARKSSARHPHDSLLKNANAVQLANKTASSIELRITLSCGNDVRLVGFSLSLSSSGSLASPATLAAGIVLCYYMM